MKNGALAKNSVGNITGKQCMSKPIMSPCAATPKRSVSCYKCS